MVRRLFVTIGLPLLVFCHTSAQVPVQSPDTQVTATLDKPTAEPGETVQVHLTFSTPFGRQTNIQPLFELSDNSYNFGGTVQVNPDQLTATVSVYVDLQANSGDYFCPENPTPFGEWITTACSDPAFAITRLGAPKASLAERGDSFNRSYKASVYAFASDVHRRGP